VKSDYLTGINIISTIVVTILQGVVIMGYDSLTPDLIRSLMEKRLGKFLSKICVNHDILTEDDLQFATYGWFLNLFNNSGYHKQWRAFNRLYVQKQSQYPDLSLFQSTNLKIVIELKHEVFRNTTMGDIGDDIDKVIGFIQANSSLSYGVVLATIWDPEGTKIPKLFSDYEEKLAEPKLFFIPIEVSRCIAFKDRADWEEAHSNLHERYRCE